MKNTKLTRSLLAACSIVALSVVVYGCDSGPSQSEYDDLKAEADANAEAAAAAAAAQAEAEAAAAAAAAAQAEAEAATAAAAAAQAEAEAKAAADVAAAEAAAMAAAEAQAAAEAAAAAQAEADAAAREAAVAAAAAAAEQAATAATEAAEAKAAAEQAAADLAAAETARMEAEAAAEAARMAQMEAEEALRMAEGERDEVQDELDERDDDAASATAKALKAAIGSAPLDNLIALTMVADGSGTAESTVGPAVPSLTPTGLMLGTPARSATTGAIVRDDDGNIPNPPATGTGAHGRTPLMAPGDSAGMLGGWDGTMYSHTSSLTGVNNSAVAYRNRGDAVMIPFAAGATFTWVDGDDDGDDRDDVFGTAYNRATRTLNLASDADGSDPEASFDIAGDMFPTAGSMSYTAEGVGVDSIAIAGTYQGASGDYHCAGTCSAEATAAGIKLTGTWHFVHDVGAMITSPDSNYLYFGWWLQKNGTGTPAYASAFTGMAGTANFGTMDLGGTDNDNDVTGSATYAGHAAGKFAISNPIGADDAGHFTADAMLTATFGANAAPNNGGVTGMLDNFMLNDSEEDAGWSVTLLRTVWVEAAAATATALAVPEGTTGMPGTDVDSTPYDESMVGTIWSVGGSAAAASGSWSAQFYDEAQGAADDGSNVPTSATGTFHSEFGEFMSMVGAFGATRE